jgi:1D-myo-inositol 3-kinase
VSKDDVVDSDLIELWTGIVPTLVVTMGREGAKVHHEGTWHHIAAYPAQEIDPTGAGDVFAAAFLVEYGKTRDAIASTRFANCAASFVIVGAGTSRLPTRSQIVDRMRRTGESIK